eukprot:5152306-Amphidinium_carterae.1
MPLDSDMNVQCWTMSQTIFGNTGWHKDQDCTYYACLHSRHMVLPSSNSQDRHILMATGT